MKLIGLLSWFDESPAFLAAAINGLAKAGVEHLIAVDGAYFHLPDAQDRSGTDQHRLITEACYANGIGLTLHTPAGKWMGGEVEKRTAMFRLAELVAEPNVDWLFVMDADMVVTEATDLVARLAETDLDVAEYTLWERIDPQAFPEQARANVQRRSQTPMRGLFRAIPGLHCAHNHYTYVTGDGRTLWGQTGGRFDQAPALSLPHVRVEHRTHVRDRERSEQQRAYYRLRDQLKLEGSPCTFCDGMALEAVAYDFKIVDGHLESGHAAVCVGCKPKAEERNRARLQYLGIDPDELMRAVEAGEVVKVA